MDFSAKVTICFVTIFTPVLLFSLTFMTKYVLQQGRLEKIDLDFHRIYETSYLRRVREAQQADIGMDS